jgi:hypothetical protein
MAQTFDTSRVGGGTYELEQDASGNYKLKSVGFAQVNKLNLPDLATSDTTSVADTTKKATEDTIKSQTTEVFNPTNVYQGGEGGGGQSYQTMADSKFAKEAKVKEATVRQAGDAMTANAQSIRQNFDQSVKDLQDKSTIEYNEAQIAKLNAEGASPQIMAQAQARLDKARANNYDMYRLGESGKTTGNFYQDAITRGQVGVKAGSITPERTTGLQTARSKATDAIGNVIDSVKNNKAVQMASNVLGFVANPIIGGVKMVASMLPKDSPQNTFDRGYFPTTNVGRINLDPATNVFGGKNVASYNPITGRSGNLSQSAQKRIDTRNSPKTQARISKLSPERQKAFNDKTKEFEKQKKDYDNKRDNTVPDKGYTRTAAQRKANPGRQDANTMSGGSDSAGGNTRVICTDLHRTKELSTRDWIRDTKFTFKTLSKTHVKGYLLWAEPTVRHIQKYPRYRKIWKHIAQHRANDIAWRLNEGKFDLLGRIYSGIGEPVCWALGNFVSDKQISKYNLTHWRRA